MYCQPLSGMAIDRAPTVLSKRVDGMPVAKQPVSYNDSDKTTRSPIALPFAKLHGLGNDFVFLAEEDLQASPAGKRLLADWPAAKSAIAKVLCDRRFGIGADGLILVSQSEDAQCLCRWSYTNSDGSASAMCGNGIRCLALWAHRRGLVAGGEFLVDTEIGAVPVNFQSADAITTDLGSPILTSDLIPVTGPRRENVVRTPITLEEERTVTATCVSMGNPHCVLFEHGLPETQMAACAQELQLHPMFPEGVNVEFVAVDSPSRVQVHVWERGAGRTLACATGAAATVVAGHLEGRLERAVDVVLPGGLLHIEWSQKDDHVRITGPAKFVFEGNVDLRWVLSKLSA